MRACTHQTPPAHEKTPATFVTGVHQFRTGPRSAAQAQLADQGGIAGFVLALEIVQQLAALCDHHQQTATRMVVFLVQLEMVGEFVDTLGQQCDLNRGRTGVALVLLEFFNDITATEVVLEVGAIDKLLQYPFATLIGLLIVAVI